MRVVIDPAMIALTPAAAATAGQRRRGFCGAGGYGCGGHVG
jgi:hypothetical protein